MPLQVIQVDFGKQESIFETIAPFVGKLVDLYNVRKMNEWNNQWMREALKDIENASPKGQIDMLMGKASPPEDYMNMDSFKEWANSAVGMLQMEKIPIPDTNTFETMPNKMEWNVLYKLVEGLSTGEVDWSGTLTAFKQRLDSNRKMGDMAQNFLVQILGQGVTDQRAKFQKDVEFTNILQQTLYPEQADPVEQLWKQAGTLPSELRADYLRQHGIDIPKAQEQQVDYNAINQFMADNNLEIGTVSINAKGEQSFSLKPRKDDQEFDMAQMITLMKEAEKSGIKLSYTKDGMSMSLATPDKPAKPTDWELFLADEDKYRAFKQAGTKPVDTSPKVPTFATHKQIEQEIAENVNSVEDMARLLGKYHNLGIDLTIYETPEYFADLMEKKYKDTMEWIKYAFDMIGEGIEYDKDNNYREIYKQGWENARHYDEEYYRVTGKRLFKE